MKCKFVIGMLLLTFPLLTSCSIHNLSKGTDATIYGGLVTDIDVIKAMNAPHQRLVNERGVVLFTVLAILDSPFSLGIDTAVFPYLLGITIYRELNAPKHQDPLTTHGT